MNKQTYNIIFFFFQISHLLLSVFKVHLQLLATKPAVYFAILVKMSVSALSCAMSIYSVTVPSLEHAPVLGRLQI